MKLKLSQQNSPAEFEERIKTLRSKINTCNFNYYILEQPSLSDDEYDMLVDELNKLEREKSTTANTN